MWYLFNGYWFVAAVAISIGFTFAGLLIGMRTASWAVGMERGTYYCEIWQIAVTAAVAGTAFIVPWTGWYLGILATWLLLWTLTEADAPEMSVTISIGSLAAFASRITLLLVHDNFLTT